MKGHMENNSELRDLYKQVIEQWGESYIVLQLAEEQSELFIAINHYLRQRGDKKQIAKEIADCRCQESIVSNGSSLWVRGYGFFPSKRRAIAEPPEENEER